MADKDDVGAKLAFLWAACGWLAKKFGKSGTVEIIIPIHRGDPINHQPWVAVEGKSKDTKGQIFWLLTHDGDNYWPMRPISFAQDGRWTSRANVDIKDDARNLGIAVAKVDAFADAVFKYFRKRGEKTEYWGPMELKPDDKTFKIVGSVVVTINGKNQGAVAN